MPIGRFISELFEHGQVSVPVLFLSADVEFAAAKKLAPVEEASGSSSADESQAWTEPVNESGTTSTPDSWTQPLEIEGDGHQILQMLEQAERVHRLGCAGRMPAFSMDHALWAAAWMYRTCRCLISRHVSAAYVQHFLSLPLPPSRHGEEASAHYSVDLVLRYVPDLIRLGRGLAEDDPLLAMVLLTCRAWPLSSVGAAGAQVDPDALETVLAHDGLRSLYVERAMLSSDAARLDEARCRTDALAAVGACRQLAAPAVADVLWPPHSRALPEIATTQGTDELPSGELM